MLKISYAGCFGLSPAISSQLMLEVCAAAKKCEKFANTFLLGVQGRSKSSMLIKLKSSCPVLVVISNLSVPICNRFHNRRANTGKITFLSRGYPSLTPLFEGNPLTQGHKTLSRKTRVLGADHSKNFVIIACTVLIGLKGVTDGQTDRWTDRRPGHG